MTVFHLVTECCSLTVLPRMTTVTGMHGITVFRAGWQGRFCPVVMRMTFTGQRNGFLCLVSADSTSQKENACTCFGCIGDNLTVSVAVRFCVPTGITAMSTDRPVFGTVVIGFCQISGAVLTDTAIIAEIGTVRAVCKTFRAEQRRTVIAQGTVLTQCLGTVTTDTAVGTGCITAVRTQTAVRASAVGTVDTDHAAVRAKIGTVGTLHTVLTEKLPCTFDTQIAGSTEFVGTVRAFFTAVRTQIRALFTALAARANRDTVAAHTAVCAEAIRIGTAHTRSAVQTDLACGTVIASLTARLTDKCAVAASVAAGTDDLDTSDTQHTVGAEIVRTDTGNTGSAVNTKLILCTVCTFFAAVRTQISTLRAAPSTLTNALHTVIAF